MVNLERVNTRNLKEIIESLLVRYLNGSKDKILIKPNWGGRLPIIRGENTDSYFLKILVEAIAKRNVKKIYIAHYPLLKIGSDDYSFENLLKITGIKNIKFPKSVEFINLELVEKECFNAGEFSFYLPKILKEVFYINLAKLKTHVETKVSLCMKNQMGMLPTKDKIAMHTSGLEKGIALLATKLKPDLCIIDGIISMDKNGPHHGRTRKTNILLYSDNLLEIDYLTSYLMGCNPREVKHINYAIDLGIGKVLSSDVIDKYNKYRLANFVLPKEHFQKFNLTVWPTTACSQCIFNSDKTQKYLKRDLAVIFKLLFTKNKTYNVVMGKGDNIINKQLSNIIAIGECTKGLAEERNINYLRGCPPTTEDIFKFIKKSIIQ